MTDGSPALREAIGRLVGRNELDQDAMELAVGELLDGRATPAQAGSFLTALRIKGETRQEILAAARALRSRLVPAVFPAPLLDTCGTGGDGLGTLNVSSAVSLLVAADDVRVAKHGNRAVSGRTGSADVLDALGIPIDLSPEEAGRSLERCRYAFFFAPRYHEALKHLAPVRRELGFRTLFNLLGPLANPAGATHQLVGVFDPALTETLAWVLMNLGLTRVAVVSGLDGMDEMTLTTVSRLSFAARGAVENREIAPEDLGLPRHRAEDLVGGDAAMNARLIEEILAGERRGPRADLVLANAGLALWVAERAPDPREGVLRARELITSGAARETLDRIRDVGRELRVGPRPA